MQQSTLAEKVLRRMSKKKAEEEQNRPHYEVLQLQVTFEHEQNQYLKARIDRIEAQIRKQTDRLQVHREFKQELDETGKIGYPRLIVLPEFLGSENVKPAVKQFYRKSATTLLKSQLHRDRQHKETLQTEKEIIRKSQALEHLQILRLQEESEEKKVLREKRMKVLKEDLRLRSIQQSQKEIITQMDQSSQRNKHLLEEYSLKQGTIRAREQYLASLDQRIGACRHQIQTAYNPVAYRDHLSTIFKARTVNQLFEKQLQSAATLIANQQKLTERTEAELQKSKSLFVYGRTKDSPSRKKGSLQKRVEQEAKLMRTHSSAELPSKKAQSQLRESRSRRSSSSASLAQPNRKEKSNMLSTRESFKPCQEVEYMSQIQRKLFLG